jgi:hypothetical protein
VARDQDRLGRAVPLADDADGLDDRQRDRGELAEEPVLALREPLRELLQRVERPVIADEANDVPADPAHDLDEAVRFPLLER